MRVTGKYSEKKYECQNCGHISLIGTNHWGECYPPCKKCSRFADSGAPRVHVCLEAPPEGIGLPGKWKLVRLGDVAKVDTGPVCLS